MAAVVVVEAIEPHMVCKRCYLRKIARLELIWCKECAEKENRING